MAEEAAKEGPSHEEGQVHAKEVDKGGNEEGEVLTDAEDPESALALNVDGLRFWLKEVLLDNLKLEKDLKLSKQARLLAAQVCRNGTPFLSQSLTLPTAPSAQATPKGKKTKKRRMVEVRHADSVPQQEVPQADIVAANGEAQPSTAASNGPAEARMDGLQAEQLHHKPVTPGKVTGKRGRDAEFDVQHESKLDNGVHHPALVSQINAL